MSDSGGVTMGNNSANDRQSSKSIDQFKERMEDAWWKANEIKRDTGEDVLVKVFDKPPPGESNGTPAGIHFLVQVKSVDDETGAGGMRPTTRLKIPHLQHWRSSIPPVVVVLWNVATRSGYWRLADHVLRQLDEEVSGWTEQESVTVEMPAGNALDDAGLVRLRRALADRVLPAVSEGRPVQMTIEFSFPASPEGRIAAKAFQTARELGTRFEIPSQFVKRAAYSDWFQRLYGDAIEPIASLTVNATPPNHPVLTRIDVRGTGERLIIETTLTLVRIGTLQVELTNKSDDDAPLWIIATGTDNTELELSFELNTRVMSPRRHLEAVRLMEMMSRGLPAEVSFRVDGKWHSSASGGAAFGISDEIRQALGVLESLATIETHGDIVGTPRLDCLEEGDITALATIAKGVVSGEAIEQGKATVRGVPRVALEDASPYFRFDMAMRISCFGVRFRNAYITPAKPDSIRVLKESTEDGKVDLVLDTFKIAFRLPASAESEGPPDASGSGASPSMN